jgi:ubiquinone/menaquinone biosynthesis C-methylase UbiE
LHDCITDLSIIGLDASQTALDHAQQRNPELTFRLGSVYSLPFESSSVHTVLLSEVLEHLDDPVSALLEVQRVAANTIIISVPHEPWFRLGNLLSFRHISRLGNPAGHIQHWSYRQFRALIRQNMIGKARFTRCFPWSIAVIDLTTDEERFHS